MDTSIEVSPEDKETEIKARLAAQQEEYERNMADTTFRYVAINAEGDLGLVLPMSVENQQSAIMQVAAGEMATFITDDGREIIFPPGKVHCMSRLTFKHREIDAAAARNIQIQQQQQQQAQAQAANGRPLFSPPRR